MFVAGVVGEDAKRISRQNQLRGGRFS
jgi:hypothetical protein